MRPRLLSLVALAVLVTGALVEHASMCPHAYEIDVRVEPPGDRRGTRNVHFSIRGCGIHRWSSRTRLRVRPNATPSRSHTRGGSSAVFIEAQALADGSVAYDVRVEQNHRVVARKRQPSG